MNFDNVSQKIGRSSEVEDEIGVFFLFQNSKPTTGGNSNKFWNVHPEKFRVR